MHARRLLTFTLTAAVSAPHAAAQSTISVDLLEPGDEGFAGIPAYRRCVDVYVDIDPADVWIGGGIRLTAHQGASLFYDFDPNYPPKFQPPLFNPGIERKFASSLSRPRPRDASARFTNAGAASTGSFDPATPRAVADSTELNVAYFASPPMTSGSPSADGYIARIAVDVFGVVPTDEYAGWFAGDLTNAPPGALIVLRSEPVSAVAGTVFVTYDDRTIRGIDWGLWYIPEPATLALLLCCTALVRNRSR